MPRIPEEKIQEIINKASIVDVISKYTKLQKQGRNYVGLCLFHSDQSPSMIVSPDKKIFKCFSCGVGGNVIQFTEKIDNISFPEALIKLASDYHVDLANTNQYVPRDPYNDKQKHLFAINDVAVKYYQALLYNKVGLNARQYLEKRHLDRDQISEWSIGYAHENNLLQHLEANNFSKDDAIAAGLATRKDSGEVYDYFRNRLVFPIKNRDGYIIGFSGRVLDASKPKYLNTRETLVFKKSELLFNIDYVWKNKERFDYIIVLEGFMDVISLKKTNYPNSLALMGTSLSNYHIQTLKQLKKPIKLFLDGDGPGINAMYKISIVLIDNKIDFSIVDNLTTMDPDELINNNKVAELNKMINNSVNPYDFFIMKFLKDQELTIDLKNEVVEKIFNLLHHETNLILIDSVLDELSSKINIDKSILKDSFAKSTKSAKPIPNKHPSPSFKDFMPNDEDYLNFSSNNNFDNASQEKSQQYKTTVSKYDEMRLKVLFSLITSNDYVKKIKTNINVISEMDQHSYEWQKIYQTIISYYDANTYNGKDLKKLKSLFSESDPVVQEFSTETLQELGKAKYKNIVMKKPSENELDDIIFEAKLTKFEKDINVVLKEIKDIEARQMTKNSPILEEEKYNKILLYKTLDEQKQNLRKENNQRKERNNNGK